MNSLRAVLRNPVILATALVLVFVAVFAVLAPAGVVEASARRDVCDAIGGVGGEGNCRAPGDPTVQDAIAAAINILSVLIGAIAVIMIIVGGFRYVTSGGDANAMKGARDTILYALVGLVIVVIAQAIVHLVLQRVT